MTTNRRDFMKCMGVAASSLVAASAVPSIVKGADEPKKQSPIFDSVKIGSLTLKNRLMRAAMGERRCIANGSPAPDMIREYNGWAAGGTGLIITGLTGIMKENHYGPGFAGFYEESQIPEYKVLTDGVHKNGAKICIQLVITGFKRPFFGENRKLYAPVPTKDPASGIEIKEGMSKEDIKRGVEAFAKATVMSQEAGFDMVEFHFAHDYLLHNFIVPYINKRTDEYGGSKVENRARFAFEIVEAVRKAVGKDFPLIAKMEGNDYLGREGSTQEDIDYVAQGLADRGVDALEITGGNTLIKYAGLKYGPSIADILSKEDQNYYARDARIIAKKVKIPLILTGGIRNIEMMEEALKYNENLVAFGMARTLLSEPDLPNKWQKDPSYNPRCISCNWCLDNLFGDIANAQCVFRRDA